MSNETIGHLLQRAGLPTRQTDCIGAHFVFTYMHRDQETQLVGRIDGLKIQVGATLCQLSVIPSGIQPTNTGPYIPNPELCFWEEHEHFSKGILPAGWQLAFYNFEPGNPACQSEFFAGSLEVII